MPIRPLERETKQFVQSLDPFVYGQILKSTEKYRLNKGIRMFEGKVPQALKPKSFVYSTSKLIL